MNEELDDPPTQRSFGVTSWMSGLLDDWVELGGLEPQLLNNRTIELRISKCWKGMKERGVLKLGSF